MVHRAQRPASASAATSPPTPRRPACTRSASTTSGAARTTPAAATRCSSRATRRPACTPAPSWRAGSPSTTWTASGRRSPHPGGGIPSYPHPRLMPNFWEFPTVSMGLGPMNAIQQARFNRYLHHRGIKDTSEQHVWAFLGDGELDEVESRGLIHVAAIDGLDNLTFVINCNLQRLDGPVRGNGKIIQELESFFRGAGWNVIKVDLGPGLGQAAAGRPGRRAGQPDEHHRRRRLPDLPGQRRRLHPGALLRPRPADQAARRRHDRRGHLEAARAAATTTARCTRPTRRPPAHPGSRR